MFIEIIIESIFVKLFTKITERNSHDLTFKYNFFQYPIESTQQMIDALKIIFK